ncbi:MAG TPA: hypothetical protein VGP90_07900 [Acidimicrobiia bacterium]|nr:hypothetical protein [Acidimicrobiia bacterium]
MTPEEAAFSPETIGAAPSVQRWFDSARLHNDPEEETQFRLQLLGDFCAQMGQTPDELAAGLRRTTKGGDEAISGKRRKAMDAAIDEFVEKSGWTGRDAVVNGNMLRSFLVHNGIFIQGRAWRG